MELTLTIIDPKYYTKPWNALDKYPLRLQTGSFDIREMVCSESEAAEYNKEIAEEAAQAKKAADEKKKLVQLQRNRQGLMPSVCGGCSHW
jgi:hypothetical protein